MVIDNEDWRKSGASWIFFEFIKPHFEANKDAIRKFVSNPLDIKTILKLSSFATKDESSTSAATSTTATTTGYDYTALLDGSIVMVKNYFTREVKEEPPAVEVANSEEFDMVDKPEAAEAYQRKGFFW